jgi:hypothetical protein
MDEGSRIASDQVLMTVVSACVLQERFPLAACGRQRRERRTSAVATNAKNGCFWRKQDWFNEMRIRWKSRRRVKRVFWRTRQPSVESYAAEGGRLAGTGFRPPERNSRSLANSAKTLA